MKLKLTILPLTLLALSIFLCFYIVSCGEGANVQRIKIIGAGR